MAALTLDAWNGCVGVVKDQLLELCVLCDRCEFDEAAGPAELTAGLARTLGSATVLVCRRKELSTGALPIHRTARGLHDHVVCFIVLKFLVASAQSQTSCTPSCSLDLLSHGADTRVARDRPLRGMPSAALWSN